MAITSGAKTTLAAGTSDTYTTGGGGINILVDANSLPLYVAYETTSGDLKTTPELVHRAFSSGVLFAGQKLICYPSTLGSSTFTLTEG